MIRALRSILAPKPDRFAVLIARRATRLANRDRKQAAAYERIHTILKQGGKA
jgi:hypothetical protein